LQAHPLWATDCKSVASAVIYVKFAKLLLILGLTQDKQF